MRRPNVGWLGFAIVLLLTVAWPGSSLGQAQAAQSASSIKPEAVAGKYQGTATTPGGEIPITADLKADKGALTGTIESGQGPVTVTGSTLAGDKVTLTIDMGGEQGTIAGTIKGDRIEGSWTLGTESGTFTLTKTTGDVTKPATRAEKPPAAGDKPPAAETAKPAPGATAGDALTGQWDGVTGNDEMSVAFSMNLKLDGDKVTGDISSEQGGAQFNPGAWKEGTLTISFEFSGMGTVTMVGSIKEGKLVGTMDIAGQMQMPWVAVKKAS